MVLMNLPRTEMFKSDNVFLVGVIPGPHEPKLNINTYLQPLVAELKTPRIFFVVNFTLFRFVMCRKSRENTKEKVRRMTRERKKRRSRQRRLGKEKEIVSAFQIEKDRFERQRRSATTCRGNITID